MTYRTRSLRCLNPAGPAVSWFLGATLCLGGCTGALVGEGGSGVASSDPNRAGTSGGPSATGPGGDATQLVSAADCKDSGVVDAGVGRWRRLTAAQYRNTVSDLLGLSADSAAFLQDSKTGPFATNADLPPQSGDIDNYQATAEKLARAAAQAIPSLLGGCDPATTGEDACAASFIADFGGRAYRHALSEKQRAALSAVYAVGKQESFAKGIELVIEAALQAPEFLYVTEFGADVPGPLRELDDYELANRLSYLFWNTMPDAALFEKAASGALKNPAERLAQAERLMQSERFMGSASAFHSQLFRIERLSLPGVISKDSKLNPEFGDELKAAMAAEVDSFVRYLFSEAGSSVKALLTAKVAFPQGPLLGVYGLSSAAVSGRVDVTDGTRSGILTLPGVMTAVPPLPTRHQAVMRGNMIRKELLCNLVPPPNVAVNFELPPNADQLSNQELLRAHKDNPSCSGCHELMDPIGFGFETYDGVGRFITATPAGDPIDATGYVQGLDGARVAFANVSELGEKLSASPSVRSCLATQWFRFALARDPHPGDECSLARVDKLLATGDGDVRQALLALVSSDSFRIRKGQ